MTLQGIPEDIREKLVVGFTEKCSALSKCLTEYSNDWTTINVTKMVTLSVSAYKRMKNALWACHDRRIFCMAFLKTDVNWTRRNSSAGPKSFNWIQSTLRLPRYRFRKQPNHHHLLVKQSNLSRRFPTIRCRGSSGVVIDAITVLLFRWRTLSTRSRFRLAIFWTSCRRLLIRYRRLLRCTWCITTCCNRLVVVRTWSGSRRNRHHWNMGTKSYSTSRNSFGSRRFVSKNKPTSVTIKLKRSFVVMEAEYHKIMSLWRKNLRKISSLGFVPPILEAHSSLKRYIFNVRTQWTMGGSGGHPHGTIRLGPSIAFLLGCLELLQNTSAHHTLNRASRPYFVVMYVTTVQQCTGNGLK